MGAATRRLPSARVVITKPYASVNALVNPVISVVLKAPLTLSWPTVPPRNTMGWAAYRFISRAAAARVISSNSSRPVVHRVNRATSTGRGPAAPLSNCWPAVRVQLCVVGAEWIGERDGRGHLDRFATSEGWLFTIFSN